MFKAIAILALCVSSSALNAQVRLDSSIGQRVRILTVADAHGDRSLIIGELVLPGHDTLSLRLLGARGSASISLGEIRTMWYAADSTRLNGALVGFHRGIAASAALVLPFILLGSALSDRQIGSGSRADAIAGVGVAVVVSGSTTLGFVKRATRWKRIKRI